MPYPSQVMIVSLFGFPVSLMGSLRMLLLGILLLPDGGLARSRCPGLHQLSNGRLFFRYGGIYVTFFCNPGFKHYGYQTSSCMSGRWTRVPPVCVASGCPDIGSILHGSSTVHEGNSVVRFRCDSGFKLLGSPMLYCNGNNWNGTKPRCKVAQKGLYSAPITSKPYGWLRGTESHISEEDSSMSEGENIEATREEPRKKQILLNYDSNQLRTFDWITQIVTTDATSSKPASSLDEDAMKSLPFSSSESMRSLSPQGDTSEYTSTAVTAAKTVPAPPDSIFHQFKEEDPNVSAEISSSTNSIPAWSVSGTELPTTSNNHGILNMPSPYFWHKSITTTTIAIPQSPESLHSQTSTPVSVGHPNTTKGSPGGALPGPESQSKTKVNSHNQMDGHIKEELMSTDQVSALSDDFGLSQKINRLNNIQLTNSLRGAQMDLDQAKSIRSKPPALKERDSSRKDPLVSNNSMTNQSWSNQIAQNTSLSANKSNNVTATLSDVHGPKLTESELQNNLVEMSVVDETESAPVNLQGPIVCPSPPVPHHGILYFHNLVRPSPWQYKYYVQYSCTPGFTLVHGDQFSFCQHNGTWSGERPVCADVNECTIGLNHCQQICINTFGAYKCGCLSGFLLAQDGKSCTDIDECVLSAGIASCLFGCINTPGSFQCHCPEGYQLSTNNGHCSDIDECVENNGRGPCAMECQNAPGSFRCSCSYGFNLAGDGRSCIMECPLGYRKMNNTEQPNGYQYSQQCVDINECLDVYNRQWQCEWRCLNLPGSFRCICPRGYILNDDKYHCEDINECIYKNGGCSQLCINNSGGYRCACPEGYIFHPFSKKNCQIVRV